MFLCAQARPRMVRGRFWDGKVGIWPIGYKEPAKRSSANRQAGTLVWTNQSVTKEKYRELLIDYVLPAVLAKFPFCSYERDTVYIQQDSAKSHIEPDDPQWLAAVEATGCKIKLYTQAAQSPDLNINDLGFFRAIQSIYNRACPRNDFELIKAVEQAYDDYPAEKINRIWLTLMSVMNAIIEDDGGNDYDIPHMGKGRMARAGNLPVRLEVTSARKQYGMTTNMVADPNDNGNTENIPPNTH